MVITPHALTGAALARWSENDATRSALVGFASHFALDRVPHRDYSPSGRGRTLLALDACVAVLLLFRSRPDARIAAGALAAILPDVISALSEGPRGGALTARFNAIHRGNHSRRRPGRVLGTASQVATCVLALHTLGRPSNG